MYHVLVWNAGDVSFEQKQHPSKRKVLTSNSKRVLISTRNNVLFLKTEASVILSRSSAPVSKAEAMPAL